MKIKILKVLYYLVLALLIIIAIMVAISVLPISGNYKFMVVQSGSMEPQIKMGAIVMVKPIQDYRIGDIITFKLENRAELITHRIHDIEVIEGKPFYITQGDANNAPDPRRIEKKHIIGRVLFNIPYLGYAVNFAKKPTGFILIIIIPALIIRFDEVKKIVKETKN